MTEKKETDVLPIQENNQDGVPGAVEVHESVLAAIARKAVTAVPGVLRLSGSSFIDNLAEMVGSRKSSFDKAILIEKKDKDVSFEIRIVVLFGSSVPAVAAAVRQAVVTTVTDITGMKVGSVDVIVMDLDDEAPAEEEPEGEVPAAAAHISVFGAE